MCVTDALCGLLLPLCSALRQTSSATKLWLLQAPLPPVGGLTIFDQIRADAS